MSNLMYSELAKYYDLLYQWKDYKKEAEDIKLLITKYKKSSGKELLEVACGSGKHLEFLKQDFNCFGVDLNEGILNEAKAKHPEINFQVADMITLDLKKKFDIITCLFSAIGYVKTYENLEKTLKNFSEHLEIGGVLIIEPWFTEEVYKAGSPHLSTYEDEDLKIARLCVSEKKDNLSVMNMHYVIAERNKEVKYFTDLHEMGMFEIDKTLKIMKNVGLKPEFLKRDLTKDRGIFIATK